MSKKLEAKTLILEYLLRQNRQGHHPKSDEILRHLNNCMVETIGIRTVQRRLRDLKDEDWVDEDKDQGYFVDEEHNEHKMNARTKLERSLAYESIWSSQNHYHPAGYPIIAFEAYHNFKGAENLRDLLEAIRNNHLIAFHYTDVYNRHGNTDRKVLPLFLKEYLNRWYLMAWDTEAEGERIFGIDRISALEILAETREAKPYYEAAWSRFDSIIGLRYGDGPNIYPTMDLVIRCKDIHVHFLDSLPIHHSQHKIPGPEGSTDETRYRYHLAPNFELEQRLLSMSSLIEILEPAWYRDAFKSRLEAMLAQY